MVESFHIQALDKYGIASVVAAVLPRLATEMRADVCAALEQTARAQATGPGQAVALEQAVPAEAGEQAAPAEQTAPETTTSPDRTAPGDTDERSQTVLSMLVKNAHLAAREHLPLCQDTGSLRLLLEVGKSNSGEALQIPSDIFAQVDAVLAEVWADQGLRNSMVSDALLDGRQNTLNNTPAFFECLLKPEQSGVRLTLMLKGGGSDNASCLQMLAPGAAWPGIKASVLEHVRLKAANACPPLVVGIGIGGSFDSVARLSKEALLRDVGSTNPDAQLSAYEAEMLSAINELGIGPGGFGGQPTALAVHIVSAPCHIAALPLAINLGCNAMRSISFELEGDWL